MTEAERLTVFAAEHFPEVVGDEADPLAVGRLLVSRCTAGPSLWTGQRILRALGVFVDTDVDMRRN